MGVTPLTITPSDPQAKFASYPCNLELFWLKGLSSKWGGGRGRISPIMMHNMMLLN